MPLQNTKTCRKKKRAAFPSHPQAEKQNDGPKIVPITMTKTCKKVVCGRWFFLIITENPRKKKGSIFPLKQGFEPMKMPTRKSPITAFCFSGGLKRNKCPRSCVIALVRRVHCRLDHSLLLTRGFHAARGFREGAGQGLMLLYLILPGFILRKYG